MNVDVSRTLGDRLRVNTYTVEYTDGSQSMDLKVHADGDLSPYHDIYPPVHQLMADGGAWVARLFVGRDSISLFTKDPMQLAEALHSLADSLTDAVWHAQEEVA